MTSWFPLTLCLALLCLLLHLTQPADLNHQLQIVGWGSWFDRGREPAPDAPTVSAVRSMESRARAGPRQSLVLDSTLTAGNSGPPGWETHGPSAPIAALASCRSSQQLQPTFEHPSPRKCWLTPAILSNTARFPNKKAGCAVSRTSGEEEELLEDDLDSQLHIKLLTRAKSGSAVEVADSITHQTESRACSANTVAQQSRLLV